jgi:DNA invertase Pin-like site-specific DNA recombinase
MTRKRRKQGNPRKAVAYLRVSTTEQRLGPEAQREQINRWAEQSSVDVTSWHQDHGMSGAVELGRRPALLAALEAIRTEGAGLLVVAKRDRLGRSVEVVATLERMAELAGAMVVSAAGEGSNVDVDRLDPGSILQRGMTDLLAMHERAVIRQRTKAALAVKKAKGERVGRVPLGMRLGADGIHLESDEAEQAVLGLVAEYSKGRTQRELAALLLCNGILNPRTGRPFSQPSLCGLLGRLDRGV